MNDPIVDEVRRVRDAHAARFNYDLDAIYDDIKERERLSGRTFVPPPDRTSVQEVSPGDAAVSASSK
jgi:hypothetical protein